MRRLPRWRPSLVGARLAKRRARRPAGAPPVLLALLFLAAATGCTRVGEPPSDPHESAFGIAESHGAESHAGPDDDHAAEALHEEAALPDAAIDTEAVETEASSVTDDVEAEASPDTPLPLGLPKVPSAPVHGRSGPGGEGFEVALRASERVGHQRRIGQKTFSIALRAEKLTYYPCSSCHVAGQPVIHEERTQDAHQDIQPIHPAEANAECGACHVLDDPERLALKGAETVPLDEAYQLCAQCHFDQVESWSGGAHGKRLDGWRGTRVVMSCTDCHDPHRPGLQKRIPFPGPRIPRTGSRQP